ncbi:Uma2 family endonuclease [Pendulispora albinea]|uniref:Uma2 family endonuclease n=1 Tax=Pendulispora albinea TaxID=2741071 RepID=A0ABZ2LPU4_9BACT
MNRAKVYGYDPSAPNDSEVEAAFQSAPPEMVAEILDGELFLQPRPRPKHSLAASNLLTELNSKFNLGGPRGPDSWIFLIEPELHLGPKPDKVVPDLAGWHRDRFPSSALAKHAPVGITVRPDWLCEVISPSTERRDRGKKMRIYRREGVGHAWLVNPEAQTLEVYRLERERWYFVDTYEGDDEVHAEPFEAMPLPLGTLWRM